MSYSSGFLVFFKKKKVLKAISVFFSIFIFSIYYTCSSHIVEQGLSTFSNHGTHGKWCQHHVLGETEVFRGWSKLDWGIGCPGSRLLPQGWLKSRISQDVSNPPKAPIQSCGLYLKMWDLEFSKQRFISRHSHLLSVWPWIISLSVFTSIEMEGMRITICSGGCCDDSIRMCIP